LVDDNQNIFRLLCASRTCQREEKDDANVRSHCYILDGLLPSIGYPGRNRSIRLYSGSITECYNLCYSNRN